MRKYVDAGLVWLAYLVIGIVWGEIMVPLALSALGIPFNISVWVALAGAVLFASGVTAMYVRKGAA